MTATESFHAAHGADFGERGGRLVVLDYGRPERTHRAVRNVAGVIEMAYDIIVLAGDDRIEYVDNVISNRVPKTDGEGCYALLLDPQGRIRLDLSVYNAGDRLLLCTPPGRGRTVADEWRERVFIQDVEINVASDDLTVFGVHGPDATETVESVLTGARAPDEPLSFVRGTMGDEGVTVFATDGPTGEEGFEVACEADDAPEVIDTLVNRGLNAVPFGYRTWEALTLEAGTPLFETELDGRIPNVLGMRSAVDFGKGCFVGQEVVSRVENRGQPSRRLVGLRCDALVDRGTALFDGDVEIGEVSRAVESPILGEPIALAFVEYDLESNALAVGDADAERTARVAPLPFVEGSARSSRLPTYGYGG